MDNIASYNSDINSIISNLEKNNKLINELADKDRIEKIKNYDGINDEINDLLYREKIIFGISVFVAISTTIATFNLI